MDSNVLSDSLHEFPDRWMISKQETLVLVVLGSPRSDAHHCFYILYSNNVAYLGIAFFYCYVFRCSVLSTVAFFKCYIFLSAFFKMRFSKYRFVRTPCESSKVYIRPAALGDGGRFIRSF